jgi:peptidoglycan/xylan/chitin deacetylase (PgdA/CDA1 family)
MSITIIDNTTEQVYTILDGDPVTRAGLAAHKDATTGVHGITSPDTIESTAGAQARVDAFAEHVQTPKITVNESEQGEQLSVDGGLRLGQRDPKFLVSFVSDDGSLTDYEELYPFLKARGIQGCLAVYTNTLPDGSPTKINLTQLLEMYSDGWEVLSHSKSHAELYTLSDEDLEDELLGSKQAFESFGIDVSSIVPPYASSRLRERKEIRKYYRSSIASVGLNTQPIHTYSLSRRSLDGAGISLATYTDIVDTAVAERAWLIWGLHSGYAEWDQDKYNIVSDLIAYIIASGGEFVTINEGLDEYGNVIDVGDPDMAEDANGFRESWFAVGGNGRISGISIYDDVVYLGKGAGVNDTQSRVTAVGRSAAQDNTGNESVFVGRQAGLENTKSRVVGVGQSAAQENSGERIACVGYFSGLHNSGNRLAAVGDNAANSNTGGNCAGVGYWALNSNTGGNSTAIGYEAGYGNGAHNLVAVGFQAGKDNAEAGVFLVEQRNLVAANPLIKGYFSTGAIILGAPTTAVADANMGNSRLSFYVDETLGTEKLHFKVKLSNGTIKTGEVNLV